MATYGNVIKLLVRSDFDSALRLMSVFTETGMRKLAEVSSRSYFKGARADGSINILAALDGDFVMRVGDGEASLNILGDIEAEVFFIAMPRTAW